MNTADREKFWRTLLSLNGNEMENDARQLESIIKYPHYLYKYRSASLSSLDNMQNNKLFFSCADPFDSFMFIDTKRVEAELTSVFERSGPPEYLKNIFSNIFHITGEQIDNILSTLNIELVKSKIVSLLHTAQTVVQSELQSICFSENGLNEQLWLKYAGNHSGFALEYDLTDNSAFLCGKSEICINCPASRLSYPIYPVYYSNEKYNATDYARNAIIVKAIASLPTSIHQKLMQLVSPSIWERERIALIKKKCHEHDEEWRMIYSGAQPVSRPYICWRPSSVTLGMKMEGKSRNLVISLSKIAGIPLIYECYAEDGDLKRRVIG